MTFNRQARSHRASLRIIGLTATVSAACLLWQAPAQAQQTNAARSDEGSTLQEVVVTAQRRTERAQSVPIAVSVVSSADIQAMGISDTNALTGMVPSLTIGESGSHVYFLRGIGTTGTSNNIEQSVASYLDGIYLYSTWTAAVPLAGIDHVEVLKGPQGTLFGRNTTGGVIQTVTRDPMAKPALEVSAGYGDYDTTSFTLYAADKGFNDKAGLSLAIDYNDQGKGFGYNITRHEQTMWTKDFSLMVKGVVEPTDTTKITGLFWIDNYHSSGENGEVLPGTTGDDGVVNNRDLYTFVSAFPDRLSYTSYLGYLRVDQKLGEYNLVSISSYRWVNDLFLLDQGTVPIDINDSTLVLPTYNWSQEFQVQSPTDRRFTWIGGVYLFHGYAAYDPITLHGSSFNAGAGFTPGQLEYWRAEKTNSYAGFAQGTFKITANTRFTGGVRYTDETEQRQNGVITAYGVLATPPLPILPPASQDSSGWTGRAVLDHNFTPDVMAYVSYNHGLKSGGFSLVTANSLVPSFAPEQLDAYEVGLKSEWFQHRLRFNAAFYWYDFANIQVTTVTTGGNAVFNAAAATFKGLDVDFEAKPNRYWTFTGALGWLDGSYTNFNNAVFYYLEPSQYASCNKPAPTVGGTCTIIKSATGKNTVYSPPISGSLGATYRLPTAIGEFRINGLVAYQDKQYVSADNLLPLPAHTTVNGYLAWQSPNHEFTVTLWANNILDEHKYTNMLESTVGYIGIPENPRTYGVTVAAKVF